MLPNISQKFLDVYNNIFSNILIAKSLVKIMMNDKWGRFIHFIYKSTSGDIAYQFTQVQNQVLLDFQIVCQKSMVDTISRLILF